VPLDSEEVPTALPNLIWNDRLSIVTLWCCKHSTRWTEPPKSRV